MSRQNTLASCRFAWLALAGLSLMLLFAPRAHAQEATDDEMIQGARETLSDGAYPWYDAETDSLHPIEIPERSDLDLGWDLGGVVDIVAYAAFAILMVAIVVLIILFLRNQQWGEKKSTAVIQSEVEPDQIEALAFMAERPRGDLLGEARRHYEAGNYSEAIIYLFSYELLQLDKSALIRLAKGKTNRQYLRELPRISPLHSPLERTLQAFESVFFGNRSLDRAGFEDCWRELPHFEQPMRATT